MRTSRSKKELGMTNPLRALGGTRGQAQREVRPKEQGWRDAGSAALALGGLAAGATFLAAHMRRAPAPRRNTVTVAWTAEPPGLFGHPEALLNAAASRVDLNVVLKAEPKGTDEHERLPRILFFRRGGRFSASDMITCKSFFDQRESSRCLVVLMVNEDLDESTNLSKMFRPDHVAQWISAPFFEKEVASYRRTSTVPIECTSAFFEERVLHPLDREPNKPAVDAIAAFIRASAPPLMV
jgi:hypothetical protein